MGNLLLWTFVGISVLSLLAIVFLNKYYELEKWFKNMLVGFLAIGLIGTAVSGVLTTGILDKKEVEPAPIAVVEEEPKIDPEKDVNVITARSIEQELDDIISKRISEQRQLYQDSLQQRKRKRWDTFRYDSLLLTVETAEKLVVSRKTFLKDDIIAYLEGNLAENKFNGLLKRYEVEVDSLLSVYRIDNRVVQN